MAGNKFQIKRTGIPGRLPNTTDSGNSAFIDVGELAFNFSDGILYSSDGNNAIEIGANVTNQNITGTLTANGSVGEDGQVLVSNGSGIYWGEGGAALSEWFLKTEDYTAENGDRILADTSANSFTVTLPESPEVGEYIEIADGANWSVNNLIIDRNGSTIEGLEQNLILDVGEIIVYFIYGGQPSVGAGPTWQVKATLGEKGDPGPAGIEISNTEPSNTEILWADTTEPGVNAIPPGGSTGQYLIKASNGDFDADWSSLETDLANVDGNIVPALDVTYDLGSANNRWRDLYLSGNTIFLGNVTITESEWDNVSTGVLPYDGTISGLTANTVKEAIDETVALTDTAYSNAISYTDSEITALGLGSLSTQNANNVNIDGGTIDDTAVNATTLTALGNVNFDSGTLFVDTSTNSVGIGTTSPQFKLEVDGSFAATTKSFLIDHPAKPGKKLRYGSLEGPENGVYVRGRCAGTVIELPDYWPSLVDGDSVTVQLTAVGNAQANLCVLTVSADRIHIHNPHNTEYFYFVQAERKDTDKLVVEIDCTSEEQ